jgi:hypothetical protein
MTKFQVNQKVYLPKFGLYAFVNKIRDGRYLIKDENKKKGWINEQYLVEFIEPKFKVGEIVELFPLIKSNSIGEIVKCALNKKRKTYYYLVFDTTDGYAVAQEESTVKPIITKCSNCGAKL